MSVFGQITHLSQWWTTATIFHQIQGEDPEENFTFLKKTYKNGDRRKEGGIPFQPRLRYSFFSEL